MNRQVSNMKTLVRQLVRKAVLASGLGLIVAGGAYAQSFRDFSQYHLTPSLVNPALAGLENDLRVSYGHRQMSIGANSFISHTASITYPFFRDRNGQQVRTSHVGLSYVADRTGVGGLLSVQGLLASYSYNVSINENLRVGLGLQAGFYNRSVDAGKLRSGSQFNGSTGNYDPSLSLNELTLAQGNNSVTYPIVNGGVQFYKEEDNQVRYKVGLAWQNINQPLYSFTDERRSNLPSIWLANAGINVMPLESRFIIEPNLRAVYLNGANNQLNLGSLFKYKLDPEDNSYGHIGVGGWYSFGNAAILSLELEMPWFFAGYSYDATVNSLGSSIAAASTNEIVVGYRMNRYKSAPKVDVTPPAPVQAPAPTPAPAPKPAPEPEVKPDPVKPAVEPVKEPVKVEPVKPVVEEAEAPVKPSKPTKARRGGKKVAPKASTRRGGRTAKYAIDKNNVALQQKYGLTDRELDILNSKPLFKLNDWELSDGTKAQLDEVADVLKAHPELRMEIGGHTCTIGTDAQNEIVGDRRSTAGLDYLISKGIAASRLTKQNYKSELPIADNETSAGRIKNRRISFKVLD